MVAVAVVGDVADVVVVVGRGLARGRATASHARDQGAHTKPRAAHT